MTPPPTDFHGALMSTMHKIPDNMFDTLLFLLQIYFAGFLIQISNVTSYVFYRAFQYFLQPLNFYSG